MDTTTETPRVWVGCLGCYNAGALVGEWIDATEADSVTVAGLHRDNPYALEADPYAATHEELWVMDFEGFDGFLSGECSPSEAQRIAEAIDALPDWIPAEAFGAWIANGSGTIDDVSDFEESYAGEWESEATFAEDLAESIGAVTESAEWPNGYIDWERAAHELFMGDYWSASAPGGVYIFRS